MASQPAEIRPQPPGRETIPDLFRRLIDDIVNLVRSELQLARSEVGASLASASTSLVAVAVGAMLAMVATSCLLIAIIAYLATLVGLVAAALIVAGVFAIIAAVLIVTGITKLRRLDLAPKRATANLHRNADLLKGD